MTLIDKKIAQGFGFTLYFLSLEAPTNISFHYWLWTQRFSTICIKVRIRGCMATYAWKRSCPSHLVVASFGDCLVVCFCLHCLFL